MAAKLCGTNPALTFFECRRKIKAWKHNDQEILNENILEKFSVEKKALKQWDHMSDG